MKELIKKIEAGELLSEKERKFIKVSMNHIDMNIDEVYQSILDAEHALSTMLPKDIMIQIFTTKMNYGMWRGLEGYEKLERYLNTQAMPMNPGFDILQMHPGQVLNIVERTLMEKLSIVIYNNRREFNDFVTTSSKEFIDMYMEETKVIYIMHPEDDSSSEERMVRDLSKRFGGIINIKDSTEIGTSWIGRIASYLMGLEGANAFEKTHNKYANVFSTAITLARHGRRLKKENVKDEDVQEIKLHVLDKYHDKFVLGHDSLVTYLKSL